MSKKTKRTPEEKRIAQCEASSRWRIKNLEKDLESTRKWREENRAYIAAYDKARRSTPEFKELSKSIERARYAADPANGKARSKAWRLKNPELAKARDKERRLVNSEERNTQSKKMARQSS